MGIVVLVSVRAICCKILVWTDKYKSSVAFKHLPKYLSEKLVSTHHFSVQHSRAIFVIYGEGKG